MKPPASSASADLFRTVVPIPRRTDRLLAHGEPLLLLGSCFAQSIGERLHASGHPATFNPLGIMYNPTSLRQSLEHLVAGGIDDASLRWCPDQELHFSFETHSSLARPTREAAQASVGAATRSGHDALRRSACLFLTVGSAWAYEHRELGRVVANCHRQPSDQFERRLLGVAEATDELRRAVAVARTFDASLPVVLTVSPVRYWREGAVPSARSKAHLLAAVHAVVEETAGVSYFPAYELVIDELRDYRWFKEDMLHPSEQAVDYVWRRLQDAHFRPADDSVRREVRQLRAAATHRVGRPGSAAARAFAAAQREAVARLLTEHPHLEPLLEAERRHFEDEGPDEGEPSGI